MMNQNPKTKRKRKKKFDPNPRIRRVLSKIEGVEGAFRLHTIELNQSIIDQVNRVKNTMEKEIQETKNRLVLLEKDYRSFVRATRRVYG